MPLRLARAACGAAQLVQGLQAARCGTKRLLSHVLAAPQAKYGLSHNELEDALTLDDECLDSIFEWWTPPTRRLPPLILTRLLDAVSAFMQRRGAPGGSEQIVWFHRQFWEGAARRYGHGDAAASLARLFADERPAERRARLVTPQPTLLSGGRFNARRLCELPRALISAELWAEAARMIDLCFVHGKFEIGCGFELGQELRAMVRPRAPLAHLVSHPLIPLVRCPSPTSSSLPFIPSTLFASHPRPLILSPLLALIPNVPTLPRVSTCPRQCGMRCEAV